MKKYRYQSVFPRRQRQSRVGITFSFQGNRQLSLIRAHPGSSPLTSGRLLRSFCLWPIQQVHLRGLLSGHMSPGPALVPVVVERRGIFQLTREVKAALQTCNDKGGHWNMLFPKRGPWVSSSPAFASSTASTRPGQVRCNSIGDHAPSCQKERTDVVPQTPGTLRGCACHEEGEGFTVGEHSMSKQVTSEFESPSNTYQLSGFRFPPLCSLKVMPSALRSMCRRPRQVLPCLTEKSQIKANTRYLQPCFAILASLPLPL